MTGRLVRTGCGVHVIRTIALSGLPAWNTRASNASPGAITAIGRLGGSARDTEQSTPDTKTWCADPSPVLTTCTKSCATWEVCTDSRRTISHSAVGRSRCRNQSVKPVEIAVATVAAAVVASQNVSSIAAASQAKDCEVGK